jgi:hypothetical protein
MITKQAVLLTLANSGHTKYRMAKELGLASSTSINQWLANTRMSAYFAVKFEELYGIHIDDAVARTSRPSK